MMRPLLILTAALLPLPAFARSIHVPQEYPTIQAAINASAYKDEIIVSPGVYAENLEISTGIVLRSTFDGTNWDAVTSTTIKGASATLPVISVNAPNNTLTIRGFRISRDPILMPPFVARGIVGDVSTRPIIEYNIIENQVCHDPDHGTGAGAGIWMCNGATIRNNIIRNNRADSGSAISSCLNVTIQNNVFYGNTGQNMAVGSCAGAIFNNTMFNNNGGISNCAATIENNIIWNAADGVPITGSSTPNYCLIKGYTGPGTGNIDADPKFVDPAHGDFHLRSDSPCIDAGAIATGVRADFSGVQRGLKALSMLKGDGSAVDIGAFEFLPQPIAVWLPGGAPDAIHPGDILSVAWQATAACGPQIGLKLDQDSIPRQDYGFFFSDTGPTTATVTGRTTVTLSLALPYSGGYSIKGTSVALPNLTGQTPFFTILGLTAIRDENWRVYE